MTLNLDQLVIFTQVIDCGGFSAAAQKLFMSQSTVSKQIRKLEASLRTTLVDRSGPTARATPAGEVLLTQAREILAMAERAVGAVHEASSLRQSRLVVGGTCSVGTYVLPSLILQFRQRFPALDCELVVTNAGDLAERLTTGEVGIGVSSGVPPVGEYVMEDLVPDPLVVVGRADHPLSGRPLTADELSSETFLLREPGSSTRTHTQEMLRRWGLGSAPQIDIWGTETIKQAVRVGLGISLMSRYAVAQDLQDGPFCVLDVRPSPLSRRVVVVYCRDRSLSAAELLMLLLVRASRW
ncbi:LysR family transcriptional regulator [Streptomyces sp. NBC_01210]|uniref:LysR family transcriptional regulator n=1 Tax=Streptomyces sp. NBC_01210 TaxID=2903774 RepID=UPI002E105EC4|nr:LysR family transcriptional regulator [Streptomyces sp. NBC_01210]